MDVKTLSMIIGHISSATTLDIYSHVTDTMQLQAAAKIDRQIGKTDAQVPPDEQKKHADQSGFQPYKSKYRKSGTGGIYQLNDHLWEGKYSPRGADGKRIRRTVYVKTREECDALIVDEMSMVDLLLMHSLLQALPPKACLIMVGDPDQLPSVGAGNLFGDLIRSGAVRTVCLTEIFRQAQESLIVMNAHAVNQGQLPALNVTDRDFFFMRRHDPNKLVQTVCELCAQRLPGKMGIPSGEIQVISPTKKGQCGTVNLNRMLQAALNPPSPTKKEAFFGENCFREGDRVMQIRNNYDILWKRPDGSVGMGVFNGDIGMIRHIDHSEGLLEVCFEDKVVSYQTDLLGELELAYAITAHKSQGSEYRAVIFVPFAGAPMLLTRGVLYTAMTRARELMIMVGNEEVIAAMTENNRRNKRYCGLRHRLLEKLGV